MQKAQIQDLETGAIVNYGNLDWVVLEQKPTGTTIFGSSIADFKPFSEEDDGKNWTDSTIKVYMTEELLKQMIEAGVQENDLVETEVDLTTVDGSTDFGKDKCKIFLLTGEQYTSFKEKIPKVDETYWLLTAYSTEEFYVGGAYMHQVRIVRPDGSLEGSSPDAGLYGVRPAVCLKPATEVQIVNSEIHTKLEELKAMVGTTSPVTFSAEAVSLVGEISDLCNSIASVQSTMEQATEYAQNMTAEQVYLDCLSKILDASTMAHTTFNVYALVPVLQTKI
ncbi:MAG: hypothetical protein K6E62_00240 [Lachnospiraceae bacterium]|nr:hypothetical protein [Lachnospiraceae bacterium]